MEIIGQGMITLSVIAGGWSQVLQSHIKPQSATVFLTSASVWDESGIVP
jgi:hypothetical protein